MGITVSFKEKGGVTLQKPVTVRELLLRSDFADKKSVVACRVNRIQRPLSWLIDTDSYVEYITNGSLEGREVLFRTLFFMLTSASRRILGARLYLRQSMNYAYFYESVDGSLSDEQVDALSREMKRMIEEREPLAREVFSCDKAVDIMRGQGYDDKADLLLAGGIDPVVMYRCAGVYDFFGGALADTADAVPVFELTPYEGGVFLSGPSINDVDATLPFKVSGKAFKLFHEYADWLDDRNLQTMSSIHEIVCRGMSRDLILICEALHTKKLSEIASNIEKKPEVRLLCLAGPSSSGKTTSSKRLRVQLLASCINSATLELDSYFVDREHTPRDADGNYDFEALEALDLDLINEHLSALTSGGEVDVPRFDFIAGRRTKGYKMKLEPGQLLVIEGIHGLNDRLTAAVPKENKYKIFIAPLTGTNIDYHNRVGTTDIRLLRRMTRDYRTRGNSPEATLLRWNSVCRGAHRHIFPYFDEADTLFNTSLAYELPVIKGYVEPMLRSVAPASSVYGEAQRLLAILRFVPVIPSDDVPNLSIMREFIGGSCFE